MECRFTLKHIHNMIITYNQLRQLDLVCKSSNNRLLMYILTSHLFTSDSVSAAIVEDNPFNF